MRAGLALGVALGLVAVLWGVLMLTESAFSVWDRLKHVPLWFFYLYAGGFLVVGAGGLYVVWILLRQRHRRRMVEASAGPPEPLTREELDDRVDRADELGIDVQPVKRELALHEQRKAGAKIHVAFFGEISSGKSSLIKALLPDAALEISARGGTTREIGEYHWRSPMGDELILSDMPGTNEVWAGLDEMSRAEALRSHVVVYVCDGDLSRSQFQDLQSLIDLGKPCIVALNKTDRYRGEELDLVIQRLRGRLGANDRVELVAVQAGGQREAVRVRPDGTEDVVVRAIAPRVDALGEALQRYLDEDPAVLEGLRDSSVFVLVARRLDQAELIHRRERAVVLTTKYSRRAMIGAMAAVTPGSDLVIQGYLGVSLLRELAKLYDVPVRQIDVDLLLELVQKRVARSTTIMLALAGNALKAFPGVGTLVGGVAHAVAYGMVFEALGKAVAASLESRGALRPAQAAQAFGENLSENLEARARRFARMALEIKEAVRKDAKQAAN
jgi:GTP-binding protein EngB required for normal cell division